MTLEQAKEILRLAKPATTPAEIAKFKQALDIVTRAAFTPR